MDNNGTDRFLALPLSSHSGVDTVGFEFDILPGRIRVCNVPSISRALDPFPETEDGEFTSLGALLHPFGPDFYERVRKQVSLYRRPDEDFPHDGISLNGLHDIVLRFFTARCNKMFECERLLSMCDPCFHVASKWMTTGTLGYADHWAGFETSRADHEEHIAKCGPRSRERLKTSPLGRGADDEPSLEIGNVIQEMFDYFVVSHGEWKLAAAFHGSFCADIFPTYYKRLSSAHRIKIDHLWSTASGIALVHCAGRFRLEVRKLFEEAGFEVADDFMRVVDGEAE